MSWGPRPPDPNDPWGARADDGIRTEFELRDTPHPFYPGPEHRLRGPLEVVVSFGPSTSANFGRAELVARRDADTFDVDDTGRVTAGFEIEASRPRAFGQLARLLAFVREWRGTTIDVDGSPEPAYLVESMAFCAQGYAEAFGGCRENFFAGPYPKCRVCPLFPGWPTAGHLRRTKKIPNEADRVLPPEITP
jgi:hypothetical protein